MASDTSVASLLWKETELPGDCCMRRLSPALGSQDISTDPPMPIVRDQHEIERAIMENHIVAIRAETGSGKTMKVPEFLFNVVNLPESNSGRPAAVVNRPVLLVLKACLAAREVVHALVNLYSWPEKRVHLRTGEDDPDEASHTFKRRQNWISVTTYDMMWKWLPSLLLTCP